MWSIIESLDDCYSATELTKNINVLDAINGLQILLSNVTMKIVCWFMKVGFAIPFSENELESVEQLEEKELLSLINNLCTKP